jgi:hypothetical protein
MCAESSRSSSTIVALSIALMIVAIAVHPSRLQGKQGSNRLPEWNADPVTNNTFLAAYVLVPIGFRFSYARIRWSVFQVEACSFGITTNTVWRDLLAIHGGIGGLGAKTHFGDEKRHELGFLVYLLGGTLYWGEPEEKEPTDPPELFHLRSSEAESFLPVNVYYRHYFGLFHVEAGLSTHLWMDIDSGIYAYWPPVQAYLGGGF